ncbi:condensin-2 complex subunit G2-like isoform X2 [Liolophura sinensis]|uniref:condensin-2 complex subunit G2-like isoform X2 n=1 Tax=Liolophura sinensis TaxID=3198878 RepID=UPI003158BD84
MTLREELLDTTEKQDADLFIAFMVKYNHTKIVDLEEALNSLGASQFADVWEKVHGVCTSTLLNLDDDDNPDNEESVQKNKQMLDVLQSVVTLATAALTSDSPHVPDSFYDTAVIIHGVMLSLPDTADKLKNSMAKLFELWWTRELNGREELGINTFTYLLERSLQNKSPVTDLKRVWAMREAVKLIDVCSQASEHVRGLLLHCYMHVSYLKSDEGRRFLSFLFSLGQNMIEFIHNTIKNQLPVAPRSFLEHYGEVYFRAWRVASGQCLQKIEVSCIQDLMHHAVHAKRQSSRSMAFVLRKVLGYIHKQKKQRGVDEMLLRLYEPILWRSLKVANGAVRANSAALLVDAFPLENPESNVEETDRLLQKQFDLLQTLLSDPYVEVRTVTVQGVCHIISVYWEVIPIAVTQALITKLYQEVIYDVSSADVRVAVIKGQLELLDNHLCHPLLKSLLPALKDFIHDTSEKVRLTMLELLLKVKSVRGIKFWSVIPMEHLLARLEIDTAPVARRIMRLIFNSFVTLDKTPDVQLSRCKALLRSNPGAARNFFRYAHLHMSLEETVKYITLLCRCVLCCVRSEQRAAESNSQTSGGEREVSDEEREDDDKENDGGESELTVHDTDLMVGLLEAMAILWSSVSHQLDKNEELRRGLRRRFAIAMPEFLNTFENRHAYSALVLLASLMPPDMVPHFSRSCLSRLKDMTDECGSDDYWVLLEAMCNWGKMSELVELITEWLEDGLKIPDPCQSKSKVKKKEKKTVAFREPRTPQPTLAIRYLTSLMSHPKCQSLLLINCKQGLQELSCLLKSVLKCLEKKFACLDALGPRTTDEFLTQAFVMYQKLEILLHSDNNSGHNAVISMEELYSWADRELLSYLHNPQLDHSSADVSTRKRKVDKNSSTLRTLAIGLVQSLLCTGCNMLLVGVGSVEFASRFTDFVSLCLQTGACGELLPLAGQALFQLTEQWRVCEAEGSVHSSLIPSLFTKLLQSMAAFVNMDSQPLTLMEQEKVDALLSSMKPTMTEMLQAVYRCRQLESKLVPEIMSSVMAAVISDLTHHSKLGKLDQDELCESLSDLPPLSAFLLSIICKKNYMATSFSSELSECISSGALPGLNGLNGAVYLTANLYHCKSSVSGLKDCLVSLQVQAEQMQQDMADYEEDSPDRLVLRGLMSRLRQIQDQLITG